MGRDEKWKITLKINRKYVGEKVWKYPIYNNYNIQIVVSLWKWIADLMGTALNYSINKESPKITPTVYLIRR